MPTRDEVLLARLDPATMRGVEIGPFYAPIAPRAGGWDTLVLDSYDGERLRDIARTHPSDDIRSQVHAIEDVDVVWAGQPLDQLPTLVERGPFDYVIASHVIEHIPDLVTFLQGVGAVLAPDGVLCLAVPDSRYCFDVFRPLTALPAVLAAHRARRTRHAPETLLEQVAYATLRDSAGAWLKPSRGAVSLQSTLAAGHAYYRTLVDAEADPEAEYVDAHAWVFVPASFELLILELGSLGLIDLVLVHLDDDTQGSEFFARLARSTEPLEEGALEVRRLELLHEARSQAIGPL